MNHRRLSIALALLLSAAVLLSCRLVTGSADVQETTVAPVVVTAQAVTVEPTRIATEAAPAEPMPAATESVTPEPMSAKTEVGPAGSSTPVVEVRNLHEEGDNPKYTVDIEYPYLVSPQGPDFNEAVQDITGDIVSWFKENASTYATIDDPNLTSYNSVNIYTTILNRDAHILSAYLEVSEYYRGAAHPSPSSAVVNYTFDASQVLRLGDLFTADADYLAVLSEYCTNELQGKEYFVFPEGAQPVGDNFRNWNVTPEGLRITFDPYQVAPYAAGFITITVPYEELEPILDPNGPLGYRLK